MDVESSRMTYASLEEIETRLKCLENELSSQVERLDDFNDQVNILTQKHASLFNLTVNVFADNRDRIDVFQLKKNTR